MNIRNIDLIMPYHSPEDPAGAQPAITDPALPIPDATPAATPPEPAKTGGDDAAMWRRKAEAAEREANTLKAADQARKDADLSETERLKKSVADTEARATKAEQRAAKLEVASELGLTADALEFITGTDTETIRAQAEKLAALLPKATIKAGTTTAPAAGQGPTMAERITNAEKSGVRGEALALKLQALREQG